MAIESNAELRERYNPEGSTLRKAQMRMQEMLDYVVNICEANGLTYWLCGGTMLGAIRHGGFIPWDDDLDIELPRKDYLRLIKLLRKNRHPYFKLHTHKDDKNFLLLFDKVRDTDSFCHPIGIEKFYNKNGLFIDLFCMEKSSRRISDAAYWFYSKIDMVQHRGHPVLARIMYGGFKGVVQPLARLVSKFSHEDALYQPLGKYRNNPRHLHDIYPLQKIEFEGKLYNAPANIDGYLKEIFGPDYMTLPDKIVTHAINIEINPHEKI